MIDLISILERKYNQRTQIYKWIEEETTILKKIKEKPIRINLEATSQEISSLNEIAQNINDKNIELAELESDNQSAELVNNLQNLKDMVNNITCKYIFNRNILKIIYIYLYIFFLILFLLNYVPMVHYCLIA